MAGYKNMSFHSYHSDLPTTAMFKNVFNKWPIAHFNHLLITYIIAAMDKGSHPVFSLMKSIKQQVQKPTYCHVSAKLDRDNCFSGSKLLHETVIPKGKSANEWMALAERVEKIQEHNEKSTFYTTTI